MLLSRCMYIGHVAKAEKIRATYLYMFTKPRPTQLSVTYRHTSIMGTVFCSICIWNMHWSQTVLHKSNALVNCNKWQWVTCPTHSHQGRFVTYLHTSIMGPVFCSIGIWTMYWGQTGLHQSNVLVITDGNGWGSMGDLPDPLLPRAGLVVGLSGSGGYEFSGFDRVPPHYGCSKPAPPWLWIITFLLSRLWYTKLCSIVGNGHLLNYKW